MIICGKFLYKHCEKVFDFKNKLHNHIRSHKCYKKKFSKSVRVFYACYSNNHFSPLSRALRFINLVYQHSRTLRTFLRRY